MMASASSNETAGERVYCFPPVSSPDARVLILGSMPGVASLQAQRYYAHPRNQFWPIMAEILGFDPELPYASRCELLKASGFALWDVLNNCVRPGSLDSAISAQSVQANDFQGFLKTHPLLERIAFNGTAAHKLFRQHIAGNLMRAGMEFIPLPSTSPAHASLNQQAKLEAWRRLLAPQP